MTRRVAVELPHTYGIEYGEILGFILGDGSLGKQISFSNAKMECIKRILEDFEIVFGVSNEDFHCHIDMPATSSEMECISYWRRNTGITKIRVSKSEKTKAHYGVLTARITDGNMGSVIKADISGVLNGKITERNVLLGFLRGFFAAEGAIIPGKVRKQVPNSIQFPQKGMLIPEAISKILKKFGIENRVVIKERKADYYCANITGYENFEKVFTLGIVDLHPEKKEKLGKGLGSYKKKISRKHITTLKLLRELQKRPLTRKEIYEAMESYPQKINSMIYAQKSCLLKKRLIKKFDHEGNTVWGVTEEGEKFIELHS